jgi:hypothetical protein
MNVKAKSSKNTPSSPGSKLMSASNIIESFRKHQNVDRCAKAEPARSPWKDVDTHGNLLLTNPRMSAFDS